MSCAGREQLRTAALRSTGKIALRCSKLFKGISPICRDFVLVGDSSDIQSTSKHYDESFQPTLNVPQSLLAFDRVCGKTMERVREEIGTTLCVVKGCDEVANQLGKEGSYDRGLSCFTGEDGEMRTIAFPNMLPPPRSVRR